MLPAGGRGELRVALGESTDGFWEPSAALGEFVPFGESTDGFGDPRIPLEELARIVFGESKVVNPGDSSPNLEVGPVSSDGLSGIGSWSSTAKDKVHFFLGNAYST